METPLQQNGSAFSTLLQVGKYTNNETNLSRVLIMSLCVLFMDTTDAAQKH